MTDSVRCTQNSNNSYTCEVDLDSDFGPAESTSSPSPSPSSAAKAAPSSPSPSSAPAPAPSTPTTGTTAPTAVPVLVERYTTAVSLNARDWANAATNLRCLSPELGLPLLTAKGPIRSVIAALKTGLDIAKCIADEAEKALPAHAHEYCASKGGRIVSETEAKAVCEIRSTAK